MIQQGINYLWYSPPLEHTHVFSTPRPLILLEVVYVVLA